MKHDPRKRYSTTTRFDAPEGLRPVYDGLKPRKVHTQPGYVLHMVVEGDRLDRLAHNYYGDPRLWWSIAQANPGLLLPSDLIYKTDRKEGETPLRVGTEIHIPPKPQEAV